MDRVIAGASIPELDGPLGKVDLERTLDSGRSCLGPSHDELLGSFVLAESACVGRRWSIE